MVLRLGIMIIMYNAVITIILVLLISTFLKRLFAVLNIMMLEPSCFGSNATKQSFFLPDYLSSNLARARES